MSLLKKYYSKLLFLDFAAKFGFSKRYDFPRINRGVLHTTINKVPNYKQLIGLRVVAIFEKIGMKKSRVNLKRITLRTNAKVKNICIKTVLHKTDLYRLLERMTVFYLPRLANQNRLEPYFFNYNGDISFSISGVGVYPRFSSTMLRYFIRISYNLNFRNGIMPYNTLDSTNAVILSGLKFPLVSEMTLLEESHVNSFSCL